MANLSADFVAFMAPGVNKFIFEEQQKRPEFYSKIFNVGTSGRQYEDHYTISGLGSMPEKAEGVAISYDEAAQGYNKRFTHKTYGLGFRFSEELEEDNLYGILPKLAKGLGRAAMHTVEVNCANVFNNGFTTADGADTKALFASDHPLVGGGTASNIPSVAADLSQTSLQDAIIAMEDTVDDRGLPLRIVARTLVVPSALSWTAQELLKSAQKPGSADNDYNALMDTDLGWMKYNYLTDTDAWFLIGDTHNLHFFWRRKLKLASSFDFDTGDAKFKATQRFSVGHSDWRGVYGSAGA